MKILFSSYSFAPNVGGIESVSAILAETFVEAGHNVELITETVDRRTSVIVVPSPHSSPSRRGGLRPRVPWESGSEAVRGAPGEGSRYRITRRPSFGKLLRLLFWCDLLFQNNISLRSLILALLLRKRVIVVHQTWLRDVNGELSWNNRIKRALLPLVTNIAISEAIREHVGVPARVIGNPYDDRVFRLMENAPRDKTLVFVGRLVSDKGIDLLLQALKVLQGDNLIPDLTIIGSGPEEQNLRRLAAELGLDRQVTFAGQKSGEQLAEMLNRHRILVVPSRWSEPFGIVALEGIACGCVAAGSRDGGLKEAIGPCGITFENGNESALADALKEMLLYPEMMAKFRQSAPAHLEQFRSRTIAASYCQLLENAES